MAKLHDLSAIHFLSRSPSGRDPHIILFFRPIILFSNSFFDFPLFFEYFPIILIILHDLGTYAALIQCYVVEQYLRH